MARHIRTYVQIVVGEDLFISQPKRFKFFFSWVLFAVRYMERKVASSMLQTIWRRICQNSPSYISASFSAISPISSKSLDFLRSLSR